MTEANLEANLKDTVVTGAARGIGLEIAKRFNKEGCHVVILDIDSAEIAKCNET